MDMSGTATTTVLVTIVALGAAADLAMGPEHRYVPPGQVTHRGPPGPAQVEMAESAPLSTPSAVPATAEPALAILGVDASKAISSLCEGAPSAEAFGPEILVCELASKAVNPIPKTGSEYLSLLLVTDKPQPVGR